MTRAELIHHIRTTKNNVLSIGTAHKFTAFNRLIKDLKCEDKGIDSFTGSLSRDGSVDFGTTTFSCSPLTVKYIRFERIVCEENIHLFETIDLNGLYLWHMFAFKPLESEQENLVQRTIHL